jgi:hypothetical protein
MSNIYSNLDEDDPSFARLNTGSVSDRSRADGDTPDLAYLLKSQARLALTLQRRVEESPSLEIKELKDIATACSTLVNGVHRAGELHRTIETYRLFHNVVLTFLKTRSDTLGEDLLLELKTVADQMSARSQLGSLLE